MLKVQCDNDTLKRQFLGNPEWLERMYCSNASTPETSYSYLFSLLADIQFSEREAAFHYQQLRRHMDNLHVYSDVPISFRAIVLDYLMNVAKVLRNPKFVEAQRYERVLERSIHDSKTGCLNMEYFQELFHTEIKKAGRHKFALSVMMLDLDNLKLINDKYGHLKGDEVLRSFVEIIEKNIREEDILGRFGGDEFILVLPHTPKENVKFLFERMQLDAYAYFSLHEGLEFPFSFSAGISVFPEDGLCCKQLIQAADLSLYRAKKEGKNRIITNK